LREEIGFVKVQISTEKKQFFSITSNPHTNFGVSDHTATDVIISVTLEKNEVDTSKTKRGDSFINIQIEKFQPRFRRIL
jgi:hypothetical protein